MSAPTKVSKKNLTAYWGIEFDSESEQKLVAVGTSTIEKVSTSTDEKTSTSAATSTEGKSSREYLDSVGMYPGICLSSTGPGPQEDSVLLNQRSMDSASFGHDSVQLSIATNATYTTVATTIVHAPTTVEAAAPAPTTVAATATTATAATATTATATTATAAVEVAVAVAVAAAEVKVSQLVPLKKCHSTLLYVGKKENEDEKIFHEFEAKPCVVTVDALGLSKDALAFRVKNIMTDEETARTVPTFATKQHITFALRSGVPAKDSVLTLLGQGDVTVLNEPMILKGKVKRFLY
jgi:hypothetical protein